MTALPLRDFTPYERDCLDAIEAAPAAEESVRERVAVALWRSDTAAEFPDADVERLWPKVVSHFPTDAAAYRRLADAVLAVLRGPSSDAEQAVERCLQLADHFTGLAIDNYGTTAVLYRQNADRIRNAVRGD